MLFFFYFILSSAGHFVQRCRTILVVLVKGHPKKHFCEIILKSDHWSRRRCSLKGFFFSIFSSGAKFVEGNRSIFAILEEGQPTFNYFEIGPLACEEMSFKGFSIFSSGGQFVQLSETILAIYVKDHPRNISVKVF